MVHYDGIANILSLNTVKERYRVTYDSMQDDGFVAQKKNGTKHIFRLSKKGSSTWMWQTMSEL